MYKTCVLNIDIAYKKRGGGTRHYILMEYIADIRRKEIVA